MASKDFIAERSKPGWRLRLVDIKFLNGKRADSVCYKSFQRYFGIELEPGQKKRITITIEESESD